jgi:tRNA 5-methylaminomethyl-2-thiouridine biosynthesis bifunctional protein
MKTGLDASMPPLAKPWTGRRCWTVLQISGSGGVEALLRIWGEWRDDPLRPALLHIVLAAADAHDILSGLEQAATQPSYREAATTLRAACYGLTSDIHRLSFADHRVMLTLGLGERNAVLRDLQLQADQVVWTLRQGEPADASEARNCAKALARLCGPGATLSVQTSEVPAVADARPDLSGPALVQCGFVPLAGGAQDDARSVAWRFAPHWRNRRAPAAPSGADHHRARDPDAHGSGAAPPGHCVVIGAGLAGSSVAASLARRGWTVLVLDAAASPAAGASSLPVGLLAPHFSADDNLFSRLTRAGARMTWQAAERLTRQHVDWELTGCLEICAAPANRTAAASARAVSGRDAAAMLDWDQPASSEQLALAGVPTGQTARWHPHAGWIKPGALVAAFLQEPGVTFRPNSHVSSLTPKDGRWKVLGAAGEELASTALVVVAAGPDSGNLLGARLPLTPVRGQVSWGEGPGATPPFPVNGNGNFIPNVPDADGGAWYLGASYRRDPGAEPDEEQDHQGNLARLAGMLPATAALLAPRFASGQVRAWTGTRATTGDHLPLAGPVDPQDEPGLWVSTGMGSRGLSFAVLCGELVAAQLNGEPWPVGRKMAAALAPSRIKTRPRSSHSKGRYTDAE